MKWFSRSIITVSIAILLIGCAKKTATGSAEDVSETVFASTVDDGSIEIIDGDDDGSATVQDQDDSTSSGDGSNNGADSDQTGDEDASTDNGQTTQTNDEPTNNQDPFPGNSDGNDQSTGTNQSTSDSDFSIERYYESDNYEGDYVVIHNNHSNTRDADVELWQVKVCCVEDENSNTSTCGSELCLNNWTLQERVVNGGDIDQRIVASNRTNFNFRNSSVKDYLPTINVDGHIYPAVHEIRDDYKDDMDTEMYWMLGTFDCDADFDRTAALRINPLICAGDVIDLDVSFSADFVETRTVTASITVSEDMTADQETIPGTSYWYDEARNASSQIVRAIDTIRYFSKYFSEKENIDALGDVTCLLNPRSGCLTEKEELVRSLLLLWLDLSTNKISPCQYLSDAELTIAELIANIERALICQNEEEIADYLCITRRLLKD